MSDNLNIPDAKASLDETYFKPFVRNLRDAIQKAMFDNVTRSVEMPINEQTCVQLEDVEASPYLKEVLPQFAEKGIKLEFQPYFYNSGFFQKPDVKCIATW